VRDDAALAGEPLVRLTVPVEERLEGVNRLDPHRVYLLVGGDEFLPVRFIY